MKSRQQRRIWLLITCGYVLFIFFNSMTPAVVSSGHSGFVLEQAKSLLALVGLEQLGITEHMIRKLAHFAEYAGLGLLLCTTARAYGQSLQRGFYPVLTAGFWIPFGDETIQLFVEGRSGQISDVWLDMSGVCFGTALWLFVFWVGKRKTDEG